MKQQYLAAGIGRPDQYTKIFSGFALEPFLAATNDLATPRPAGPRAGGYRHRQDRPALQAQGARRPVGRRARAGAAAVRRIKFLLVGDGPWRGALGEPGTRARAGKARCLHRPGRSAAVPPLVGIMDMLVHLSLREGLPRALPQALAAARPVVAYDADGAREVCFDNETGFLLRPGDLAGLSERLLRLAQDPALRQRLGQRGQQFVQERSASSAWWTTCISFTCGWAGRAA